MHTKNRVSILAALVSMAFGGSAMAADLQTFARGSLIIPEQANFQTGCGSVSAYGLVWRLLKENRVGGAFADNPVTIYWIINGDKSSPNRCIPSNRHTAPSPSGDARWNDGCDLTITNATEQPVVPVNYSMAWPAGDVYPYAPIVNYTTTTAVARPAYAAKTLDNVVTGPRFETIRYMGGPFVIDATDAKRVINFMRTSLTSFTNSNSASTCACGTYSQATAAGCHYIAIHQATIQFDAPVNKRINKTPPKIALLDVGIGVSTGILTDYLAASGLNFAGAAGCPQGSTAGCTLNGGNPGEIYDKFHAIKDLVSTTTFPQGLLNATASGKPRYSLLWTPHWVIEAPPTIATLKTTAGNAAKAAALAAGLDATRQTAAQTAASNKVGTYAGAGDVVAADVGAAAAAAIPTGTPPTGANATQKGTIAAAVETAVANAIKNSSISALANIAYFANKSGNGLFAECASLESYEGSSKDGSVKVPQYNPGTAFLYTKTLDINGLPGGDSYDGRNCTDPDYSTGECVLYPNPGDPFSQVGDYHFESESGHVHNYRPLGSAGSAMKPGVKRLAVSWKNYTTGAYVNTPPYSYTLYNGWDFFTLGMKDNDPNKATIVYLAGHKYTDSVAGTRIVLNTLLNLGSNPTFSDRAIAAPVAFDDVNGTIAAGTRALLFSSTYKAVSGTLLAGNVDFDPVTGSRWMFPFVKGDLRAHTITGANALNNGESELNEGTLWSADAQLPTPGKRNLFTYVGGKVTVGPTMSGNNRAPHDVLQTGWKPVKIAASEIQVPTFSAPHTGCTDVIKYSMVKEKGVDKFGFVDGADGICDLQQLLQRTDLHPDASWQLVPPDETALTNDAPRSAQLLSLVRGFCYATSTGADGSGTPVYEPATAADCNNKNLDYQDNAAHMGGLVHSSAAVVPPSENVADSGAPRPTVAYVGGFDGQLHAIYVSGGSGYTGPAGTVSFMNPDASSAFVTDYSAKFAASTPPLKGTELWSFMPSTQLAFLRGNNARVDSSPVVQDVFVDLVGSGIREWHTVLVASVGTTGREIFAIDVTNPLKPVLLWDVVGSTYQIGAKPGHASAFLADGGPTGFAFKWDHATSNYKLPPAADPGRLDTGLYDYSDLGGSSGLTIGQMRAGLEPLYAVIVSSNSGAGTPSKGLEIFAIDVATGQKLWQWQQGYIDVTRVADNTVPPVVALRYDLAGVKGLFAGDMEGRLWDLEGMYGRIRQGTGPVFDTGGTLTEPHPITSNIAIARVPSDATGDLASYKGENILMFGTAGADWVPGAVGGNLFIVHGLDSPSLASVPSWPRGFSAPERIYGNITIAGRTAFIPSAKGQINDLMALSAKLEGKTYEVDLGNAGAPSALMGFNFANFGGVAVYHQAGATPGDASKDFVLVAEVGKLAKKTIDNTSGTGPASPDKSLDPDGTGITVRLMNWMRRFLRQ